MQLINGRTPEQWRAYDRWKLIVAVVLALLLLVLWLADRGPGRAGACCAVPGTETAAVAPPEAEVAKTPPGPDCPATIDAKVMFAASSSALGVSERDELGELVPCMAEGRFRIDGHADSSGTDAINTPLAEARAQSVVDYIVRHGVEAARLTARGHGSSQPLVDNATPDGRAQNRRTEIHEE